MLFIKVTVQMSISENLERISSTVNDLKQFISTACLSNNVSELYNSRYLFLFFSNKSDSVFHESKPLKRLSAYQLSKLKKKKKDDKKKNVAMVKMLHELYWS